jgi:hypothetical protein
VELPAWFNDPGNRKKINERSARQERKRAEQVGGKVSAGSGSSYRSPQDVRSEGELEQLKFTDKDSFTIKVDEWKKIRDDALRFGREPRMVIDFEQHGIRMIIEEE